MLIKNIQSTSFGMSVVIEKGAGRYLNKLKPYETETIYKAKNNLANTKFWDLKVDAKGLKFSPKDSDYDFRLQKPVVYAIDFPQEDRVTLAVNTCGPKKSLKPIIENLTREEAYKFYSINNIGSEAGRAANMVNALDSMHKQVKIGSI